MKIALLHMTLGLINRGSEIISDSIAGVLSHEHEVLVIQSGVAGDKPYAVKRIMPLRIPPPSAPRSAKDKILFRLKRDENSRAVRSFTARALLELKKFSPDIIIAVNGARQVSFLKKQMKKSKIVVFGHAGIGYHDAQNLRAKPDLFIALSREAQVWGEKLSYKSTKVVYVPNAVDTEVYKKARIKKLKLPHPIVITVGALTGYKNISSVIEAVSKTPCSLLLIGDGEERNSIAQKLSVLANDFSWVRHVDPVDLPSYYKAADVFCFVPDSQEAFGLVYIEAMAAGLPVIASDDAVRRDIVGSKGIFVDPHNPEAIGLAILKACKRGVVDYGSKLEKYGLENVVKKIEHEFYELLK